MIKKNRSILLPIVFAFSIGLILWITLFSRIGTDSRGFYPPLWSYRVVLSGNRRVLLETIGNIILFIPLGLLLPLFIRMKKCQAVLAGACLALLIESLQWLFHLGSFEIDDVINNTVGVYLGVTSFDLFIIGKGNKFRQTISISIILIVVGTMTAVNIGKRIEFARLNDRADGAKNLLVLNYEPGYVGKSDFNVEYLSDGSLSISGSSSIRAWKEIGSLRLRPGTYTLSGFSGTAEKTVGIELEYFDNGVCDYIRLTRDIGPIEEVVFELSKSTQVRALIGVYPGGEGEFIARPVVYRED